MIENIGEYIPDNLIGGTEVAIITKGIELLNDQGVLKRGTVLGKIKATGLCVTVDSSKTDGSQESYAILTDDIDTHETTPIVTTAYITGVFNKNALIFGGSDTFVEHEENLRIKGIHLKNIK